MGIALMFPALIPARGGMIQVVIVLAAVVLLLATVFGVMIATQISPLRPIAEISILGKHFVGVSRSLVGLAAFFGGMIVTWIITLDVSLQAQKLSLDVNQITGQLWQLFLSLAPFIAYIYWLGIAVDLMRVRKHGRLLAAERFLASVRGVRYLSELNRPLVRRQLRRLALAPWWAVFATYYIAPVLFFLVGSALWQIIS
ncbi:hypothetical protein [Leucobacter triazinivorans]|uniref:Uncharacterized protein n=1 Tax=Leucobacter triazinivorans TaxID=1784719 RepID=A0A4V0Z1H7_9MICO|nr:hypothetical protein [Leucobacter triazinivorans]QBE48449.1 hypothetical protein EVS81_06010 [Leucobacter triazinivorans]